MTSTRHEGLVELLRDKRRLLKELLRLNHVEVPRHDRVTAVSERLGDALPREVTCDALLRFDHRGTPVQAVIVEVQLHVDDDKCFSWPLYVAGAAYKFRCPVVLVVLTPSRRVAHWAREKANPGAESLVLGPDEVPFVTAALARRQPDFATLSAMIHGHDDDPQRAASNAFTAFRAARASLKQDDFVGYYEFIFASLTEPARKVFRMLAEDFKFTDPLMQRSMEKGVRQGRVEGLATGVLALLKARKVKLSSAQRKRVLATRNLKTLERWLLLAAKAESADQLFPQ